MTKDDPFADGVALAKSLILDAIPKGTQARVASVAGAFLLVATLFQLGQSKDTALAIVDELWDGLEKTAKP